MLKRKMLRDLRTNLAQFMMIFLMVLLAVMVFAGVHAYMDGMRVSADKIYDEYNLADMWLTGNGFSQTDIDTILQNENVQAASPLLTVTGSVTGRENVSLELNFLKNNDVCRMYVFEGETFDPDSKDGVWLDKEFAEHNDLKAGDTLTVSYAQYQIRATVAGLIETPDHAYSVKDSTQVFPDHATWGYAYYSYLAIPDDVLKSSLSQGLNTDSALGNLLNNVLGALDLHSQIPFPYILVKLKDPDLFDETKAQLQEDISSIIAVTGRKELSSYAGYNSEVEEGETYAFVFTALFLFIAILSVITTMNRFVRKERTQIGTLKALGFRRSRIVRLYISYTLVLSIAAAVTGVILGVYTIGVFFLNMEMEYFEMPQAHITVLPVVYMVAVLCVAVIVLITWLSCRQILNEPASQALRAQSPHVKNARYGLTTRGLFRHASSATKWNLRDIGRNKGRTVAAAAGIMGCTMLVVTALGMYNTMHDYLNWEFSVLNSYESYIVVSDDCTEEQYQNLLKDYGDETSHSYALEVQEADGTASTQALIVTDAPESIHFTGHNREIVTLSDDGFYITEKLSKTLGLDVGDEVTWHIYGDDQKYTVTIAGTYRDPQNQRFACTRACLESLGITYRADTIYSGELLDRDHVPEGASVIQTKEGLESGIRRMLDTINSVIVLFIILSALLAVVILYNLGLLSFSEKQYQFATMKVLGYRDSALQKLFTRQGSLIAVISVLLGLPAGYWMVSYIFSAALGDGYDFPAVVFPSTYIIAGLSIFAVSLLVNALMSRKIRKIDMVSSLKANE